MNFMLFTFLSGVFSSGISGMASNNKESDMVPIIDEENNEEEIKDNVTNNEKNDHNFTDTKQYVFTTRTPNGTQSEISVKATTDLRFAVRNYKLVNETTTPPSGKSSEDHSESTFQKSTQGPNEPAFWTMLAKALNGTKGSEEAKDQLFQPVPSSDFNATNEEEVVGPQDNKLKLMLGISLMTLCLFVILLAVSSSLLYKLKTSFIKKREREYTINPQLANLSYFHPAEGVSDSSFSRSGDSSTVLGTKSKTMDAISTVSEED
ncbi:equatorin [Phyllostomus discolor]|uniref:Equatorin n=1 Tax=Phyllostomus discolor TaxID=89673 RepID=A0A834B693_9CHIR|nr:equatorin [Phyllostomus discolor]